MAAPQQPADLADWMVSVEQRLTALGAQARSRAALNTVAGDLVVTGDGAVMSDDFDGTGPLDPGTSGWWLGGEAAGAVFNEIFLRQGIVGDDALANPVAFDVATPDVQTAWATSTSMVTKATTTLTVPAGYTRALVFAFGSVVFQDSASNRFDSRLQIGGVNGPTIINLANLVGASPLFHSRVLTGLSPGTITLNAQVLSAVATAGVAANQAQVGGLAIFRRT